MAVLVVFTQGTDYPSETGYLLDNSRRTDNMSEFENGMVLILDGESACLYPSVFLSSLTDSEDGLSVSSVKTANGIIF